MKTDADYADDLALLTNTSVQAECLLHSREQAARGLDINSDKKVLCFKQDNAISTISVKTLKFEHFTYLGSNISSTESDVIGKAWDNIA